MFGKFIEHGLIKWQADYFRMVINQDVVMETDIICLASVWLAKVKGYTAVPCDSYEETFNRVKM